MHDTRTTPGTLYIVPTPIGNLEDITLRALRILKEVDLIAAEDTRHTKNLLNHFGIATPLISYYREKEAERSEEILLRLEQGQNLALVSDAGTPAISDPGAVVVKEARHRGLRVVPLPGACAVTTAMSGAGITADGFLFLGFLPAKSNRRRQALTALVSSPFPLVFYEAPHRISDFLADVLDVLGDRPALWARELTKSYEELLDDTIAGLLEKSRSGKNRGEFVIIVHPGREEAIKPETLDELILWYRDNAELSLKDVSQKIAADLGLSRSQVYQRALALWR
jgi:16S rRNA (cytidine1402-2'-O)-methyltransferase